jgi:DNA-binding XRE family transcriptional regulator
VSGHHPFAELGVAIESNHERRARVDSYKLAMEDALKLSELRAELGITQVDMARNLNVSQSNVSRIEHEDDLYISTLRGYVEALGGELQLQAVFPDRTVRIVQAPESHD